MFGSLTVAMLLDRRTTAVVADFGALEGSEVTAR